MSKLQLIQAEIETLTLDDFTYLKNWINELDAQKWEKQIESDSHAGKLDFLYAFILRQVEQSEPWVKFAGMFKDDPLFDDFVEDMAAYRRENASAEITVTIE